jgi:hypothetical protein
LEQDAVDRLKMMRTKNQSEGAVGKNCVGRTRFFQRGHFNRWRVAALSSRLLLSLCVCGLLVSSSEFSATGRQQNDQILSAARSALERADYETALLRANEALKSNPGDATAKDILVQAQKGKDAQDAAHEKALKIADDALKSGDYDRAIDLLQLIIEGWPSDQIAKDLLLTAQQRKGANAQYQAAIAKADQALEEGNFTIAIQAASQASRLRPGDRRAEDILLRAHLREKAAKSSEPRLESVVQAAPSGTNGATRASEVLTTADQIKESNVPYEAAIAKAEQALRDDNYSSAIESASQAASLRPGDRKARDIMLRARIREQAATKSEAPPINSVVQTDQSGTNAPVSAKSESSTTEVAPDTSLRKIKPHPHEVTVSGDYFLGQGQVTMPFGFALSGQPDFASIKPSVATPNRNSDYIGASASYGYKQQWYIDVAYAHGDSSGTLNLDLGGERNLPSEFSIRDDILQVYLRYTPKFLLYTPVSAYLRVGGSFVQAKLHDNTTIPDLGVYVQDDNTQDYLGNFGAGVGYGITPSWSRTLRIGFQLEAEGFFGSRSQDITEDLPNSELGFKPTAKIDNTLYGGIGRGTVRVQYGFGKSGLLKVYLEGGVQGKFTNIKYSSEGENFKGGSFDELLWGPYAKVGVRMAF